MDNPKPSSFVNTVAWVFIVFTGYATIISLMQNILVFTVIPDFVPVSTDASQIDSFSLLSNFMFNNFHILVVLFALFSATFFTSSIALLKRKNWGRMVFIAFMYFGIIGLVGGFLVFLIVITTTYPELNIKSNSQPLNTMMTVMLVFFGIFYLGISGLFGWIIKKLSSDEIKSEFMEVITYIDENATL